MTVDGQEYSSAEEVGTFAAVEDGVWTVTLDAPLGEGEHTVEAVQTFNGQTSGATTVTFTVTSADNGNDGGDNGNDGGDGGDNGNGGGEDGGNGDDGELAVTGSDFNVLPMSLAGIVLLALGAGAVVLVLRQRRASVES